MEYVFGSITRGGVIQEILKTKNEAPSDLSGKMTVDREYSDCIIYDTFVIDRKYQSKHDDEDNYYDWYYITDHFRYIDKYTPNIGAVEEKLNTGIADTQDALCEVTDDIETRLADIENALCELTEE